MATRAREKSGKHRFRFWMLLLCVLYPLIASGTLEPETAVIPVRFEAYPSMATLPGSPPSKDSRESGSAVNIVLPVSAFASGNRAGYADSGGSILWAGNRSGIAAMDDSGWSSSVSDGGFSVSDPFGKALFETRLEGYPFFQAGRRFALREDQRGVTEIDTRGQALWTKEFPSIVTAFSAGGDIAAFGLLDGSIRSFARDGTEEIPIIPAGSRLSCIYSLAVSPDGKDIAAISGQDPQRFVVYRREGIAYTPAFRKDIPEASVRPLSAGFSADGSTLVAAIENGLVFFDLTGDRFRTLKNGLEDSYVRKILSLSGTTPLLMTLEGKSGRMAVGAISAAGTALLRFSFAASDADIVASGEGFVLALDDGLYRYEAVQR